MGRGPESAAMEMVDAALGAGGEAVCARLVGLLRDKDKAAVEQAARTLKKISEADAGALALAVELMFERLRDKSGLNRTMAMQALVDLSEDDAKLRARVMPIVREFLENGTPAMRARAKRLLAAG